MLLLPFTGRGWRCPDSGVEVKLVLALKGGEASAGADAVCVSWRRRRRTPVLFFRHSPVARRLCRQGQLVEPVYAEARHLRRAAAAGRLVAGRADLYAEDGATALLRVVVEERRLLLWLHCQLSVTVDEAGLRPAGQGDVGGRRQRQSSTP